MMCLWASNKKKYEENFFFTLYRDIYGGFLSEDCSNYKFFTNFVTTNLGLRMGSVFNNRLDQSPDSANTWLPGSVFSEYGSETLKITLSFNSQQLFLPD